MAEGINSTTFTIGALIAGCMTSVGLSAIVGFQTFLYFQIFPTDTLSYKALVGRMDLARTSLVVQKHHVFAKDGLRFTDTAHTVAVCTTIWQYAVLNFNKPSIILEIVSAYPVSILLTLIATLNANLFYARRIHKMSKKNWWLTGPICVLCTARTALGLFTAIERHHLFLSNKSGCLFYECRLRTRRWDTPVANLKATVVGGMAVSVATDIVISAMRYYYLRDLKQGYIAIQEMVDAVVIFTINDGLLTCAIFTASITCFLTMPKNFVWIGIYSTGSKRPQPPGSKA
ncbi:hypothetical protein MVEN_00209400 [Mycena venus]|uniref:DUF6534 domain-containing protein n=1 Tax=Mycena venus TaxID=2733690 RepID=A0A8H6Z3X5_9AGAR|nr:hypothetical protein MVEN_00209400 [Mycena venus]